MWLIPMHTISGSGNRESCLGHFFGPFTNSDQCSFQILLCQMEISTFSWQNKVIKMYPKYLLTQSLCQSWSSQYQIQINRSDEIKQCTTFQSFYLVCEYEGRYSDCLSNMYGYFELCTIWSFGLVVNVSDFGTRGPGSIPGWVPLLSSF